MGLGPLASGVGPRRGERLRSRRVQRNNMEQIQAIMEAAEETDSPVIVQASRGARAYSQDAYLKHLMLAAVELYPHIPVVMHQDHGNSRDTCQSAIDNGFTSVMMDGSLKEDRQDAGRLRLQRPK